MTNVPVERMQTLIKMIEFMASTVKQGMAQYILLDVKPDQYAIKHQVNPDLTVSFYLYNTENQTQCEKRYTYEAFALICSNQLLIESTFKGLAEQMLDTVQRGIRDYTLL